MAQVQTRGIASWRLKHATFLATACSRRPATLDSAREIASRCQSPTPTIRHSGPRALFDSPCFAHSLSVHCLCKTCNPDPNARHPVRPAPPPTAVAPPAARIALPAVRAPPFGTASAGFADDLGAGSVDSPSPRPSPAAFRRRRAPRPRQFGEGRPGSLPRRWQRFFDRRHAPKPAKTPPAPPQEFFGKNSYCARGARSRPRQHPQRPRTLSRPLRRSHAPCPGDLPAHPRRAYGPTRRVAAPLGAVVPGVRSPKSRSKNPPKPSLASPSPLGTGWRETVPPSPPRLCGPRPPRRPCTLLPRSTVTPESRS